MKKNTIIDEKLLIEYDSTIWGIMYELRAADGFDERKMNQVFSMLEQIKSIYEKKPNRQSGYGIIYNYTRKYAFN